MLYQLLKEIKAITASNQTLKTKILSILELENIITYSLIGLVGTFAVNFVLLYFCKNISKYSSDNKLKSESLNIRDLITIFCSHVLLTIFSYGHIIKKFTTHIFAIGGDSYNHYARLVESKYILEDPNKSIFHWPGIFYPDGLTAFDGAPTIYNDLIHYFFSKFAGSVAIYNLLHLSTFPLAGIFCYLLAHEITKDKFVSYFTSFIFAFSHQHYLSASLWLNITHIEFIPLIFWLYIRTLKYGHKIKYYLLSTTFLTILGYQSLYFFFMTLLLIVLFFIIPNINKIIKLSIPIGISSILLSFWMIPMMRDPTAIKSAYKPHIDFNLDIFNLATGKGFLGIFNEYSLNPQYLGIGLLGLVIISLLKKYNSKQVNMTFIIIFTLSLGSMIKINGNLFPIILPEILLSIIPPYKSIRATDRYLIFLMIPVGIMAGTTVQNLVKNKFLKMICAASLIATQFQFIRSSIDVRPPKIYNSLPKTGHGTFGILEFPLNNPKYWMWRAGHRHHVVYGYLFIRGKKDKLFYKIHQSIIRNKKLSVSDLATSGIRYIVSHRTVHENLYADLFGAPKRINKEYKGISDYIEQEDINKLHLHSFHGNSYLYEIKDNRP